MSAEPSGQPPDPHLCARCEKPMPDPHDRIDLSGDDYCEPCVRDLLGPRGVFDG